MMKARILLRELRAAEKKRLWRLAHPIVVSKVTNFINENYIKDDVLKESYVQIKEEIQTIENQMRYQP